MAFIWLTYGSYMAYLTIGGPVDDRCDRCCVSISYALIMNGFALFGYLVVERDHSLVVKSVQETPGKELLP